MPLPENPESRERSLANLKPITNKEQAQELGRRSGEARRIKRQKAEELALRDLIPLSLQAQEKALKDYLAGQGEANPALRASESVQDREWGKPTQRTETVQLEARPLAELSQEELLERAREAGLPVLGERAGAALTPRTHSGNP